MGILYDILFLLIGGGIGWGFTYMRVKFKYEDKEKIDQCYEDRKNLESEKANLESKIKELEQSIKSLNRDLEKAKREIMEKNKYLSEDKVVIERLYEVKKLSDKISSVLIEYDKETIKQLLEEYKKGKFDIQNEEETNSEKKR